MEPSAYGTTDAAGIGMGGVLLPPCCLPHRAVPTAGYPIVWRSRFGSEITNDLVTFENPRGRTTNSDLELAATVVQHDVIATNYDVRERTLHTATDNKPMLFWHRRGSISTNTTPAYLLRMQALHPMLSLIRPDTLVFAWPAEPHGGRCFTPLGFI
jgi:hypothetical protein